MDHFITKHPNDKVFLGLMFLETDFTYLAGLSLQVFPHEVDGD